MQDDPYRSHGSEVKQGGGRIKHSRPFAIFSNFTGRRNLVEGGKPLSRLQLQRAGIRTWVQGRPTLVRSRAGSGTPFTLMPSNVFL